MRLSTLAVTLFSAAFVHAHTTVYGVWINGVFQYVPCFQRLHWLKHPPQRRWAKLVRSLATEQQPSQGFDVLGDGLYVSVNVSIGFSLLPLVP